MKVCDSIIKYEAEEKGRDQGQRDALLLTIQRVLALRFELELEYFAETLQGLNFAGVKHLNDVVFDADTVGI